MYARILKTDPYREPAGSHEGGRFAKDPNGSGGETLRNKMTPEMLKNLLCNSWEDQPKPLKKGDKFIALRLTGTPNATNELAGYNGGNILGVLAHVANDEDDSGTYEYPNRRIWVHEVTCTEDASDTYRHMGLSGHYGDKDDYGHDNPDTSVGVDSYYGGKGYSFPSGGRGFTSKCLGALPTMGELLKDNPDHYDLFKKVSKLILDKPLKMPKKK